MKKTYIQPSTMEVKISTLGLLMASGDPTPKFDPTEETDVMESRRGNRRSVWDDEEDMNEEF